MQQTGYRVLLGQGTVGAPSSILSVNYTTQVPRLTMQHPRSLVLLGAIYSFTAAAAGSLPRGVSPECQLADPWQHSVDGSPASTAGHC